MQKYFLSSFIPCVAYVMSRVTRVPDLNHLECLPVRAIFRRGYTNRIKDYRIGSDRIWKFVTHSDANWSICQRQISMFSRYANLSITWSNSNRCGNEQYKFSDISTFRSWFFPHKTVINLSVLQRKSHFIFENICFWFRLFLFSCRKWH